MIHFSCILFVNNELFLLKSKDDKEPEFKPKEIWLLKLLFFNEEIS